MAFFVTYVCSEAQGGVRATLPDSNQNEMTESGLWCMVLAYRFELLRSEGMPYGVMIIAKNQMTGPPTVPAFSSMTPEVTMAKRKVRSAIPMMNTPMK